MTHRNVLVQTGGGTRGLIQMAFVAELEKATGKQAFEIFDLIVGASVGAIGGGTLASGVSAEVGKVVMSTKLSIMFKKRSNWNPRNWFRHSYDRNRIFDVLRNHIPQDLKMSELRTKFVCTAWDMNNQRPIFFKSYKEVDGDRTLFETLSYAFAAPIYFGMLSPASLRLTLTDADVGDKNNPLEQALQECYRLGWLGEGVEDTVTIICVGSGRHDSSIEFSKSRNWNYAQEIIESIRQGSSNGVADYDINCLEAVAAAYPSKLRFKNLNCPLTEKMAEFGNVDYLNEYIELGKQMFIDLDQTLLTSNRGS